MNIFNRPVWLFALVLISCAQEPDTLEQSWKKYSQNMQKTFDHSMKELNRQPIALNERPEVRIVTAPHQWLGLTTLRAPGSLRAEGIPVHGQIMTYHWRVGRSMFPWELPETWINEASGQRLDYTFDQPGLYRLQLTVNNLLNPQELSSSVVTVVVL